MERKLNIDVSKSVIKFESVMNKVLPKKTFYKSLLKGKGLEFDSYRNFSQDEDSSLIDWKASNRANVLLAKQYVEERDLGIMFIIDIGENMVFGSQEKLKCEYAAEVSAALSHIMINSGDRIGYYLFNDKESIFNLPLGGKKQFDIFINTISDPYIYSTSSNINDAIEKSLTILDRSINLVVIISDFLSINKESIKKFEEIGNLFETISILIQDPLDINLPELNKEITIEDPTTHERLIMNPSIAKNLYKKNSEMQLNFIRKIMERSNIDILELNTSRDFTMELATFLKNRTARR